MTLATIDQHWEAIIVGAGVAGSTLASLLARFGWKTLLLDRAPFPREKVCGCCLSPAAVTLLERLGLAEAARDAVPITHAQIIIHRLRHRLSHPGLSISRATLDDNLAQLARRDGATFLHGALASDGGLDSDRRLVHVRQGDTQRTLCADLVLLADGLASHFADDIPELCWDIATPSRLGIAANFPASTLACPDNQILILFGHGGYLGVVRVEDGSINLAGAFDPAAVHEAGGPTQLVSRLLRRARIPHNLPDTSWHGTPLLTRHRLALGATRLLTLGDACGYVEPFTGQGMTWAILSAAALSTLLGAPAPWNPQLPQAWAQRHHRLIGRQMKQCQFVANLVRHPIWFHAALATPFAGQLARRFHRPPPLCAYSF